MIQAWRFCHATATVELMLALSQYEGRPWGTTTTARAAIRSWHLQRGLEDFCDNAWTARAVASWRGWKKKADHSRSSAKRPVTQNEISQCSETRVACQSTTGVRDEAAVTVCFYGVRRCSEIINLRPGDVSIGDNFVDMFT